MKKEIIDLNTLCVHEGKTNYGPYGTIQIPLYLTSNYRLPSDGSEIDWDTVDSNIYSRNGNENQFALEKRIAAIEGAEACVVLASGVAALSGTFLTLVSSGDHIICSKVCYAAVSALFRRILPQQFNFEISMVDTTNVEEVRQAVKPNTKLIHIETPGNPTTGISDIAEIAKIAKAAGAYLSVDSTFASPYHQSPIALGADLSINSMTKYINGHGDVLGGCICGSYDLIHKIKLQAMVDYGGVLSPFNSWLIFRSLSTFPLRMKQHSETAMKIAQYLESKAEVRFVFYPGLKSHPQHELATKQMKNGYSAMIVFGIKGDAKQSMRFIDSLDMITHAVSLGDTETLITYTEPERDCMQYYPEQMHGGYFRLSIGLESPEAIIADFEKAFKKVFP